MTDIVSWSPVDASNNAAPPAGWPENMQPSAVNDCARAMMGAIRRYYDTLLSGSFVLPYLPITGGTVTGSLHVTGGSNLDGGIATSSIATSGNLHVDGTTTLVGSTSLGGSLSVGGSSTLTYLHVIGMSDLDGGVRISSGSLSVAGSATISAGATVGSNLTVSGQTTINGGGAAALNVPAGGITIGGFASLNGGANIAGSANISVNAAVGGTLTVSAQTVINGGGAGALNVPAGGITIGGFSSLNGGAAVGGNLTVSGQITITGGGAAALNVPNGGIIAAGVSSFPCINGGPGGAGTLQAFGTGDRVCFRWDGYNLYSRVDEAVEQRIPYANNFNGFDLGNGGGASPTGYDLTAYSGASVPFIVHVDIVSDRRLKENVRGTQVDALGAILATPVRAFDWNEAGRRYMPYIDPHAPIGLVAQEVQETMPWVVGVSNFKESDDVPVHDMHRVLHDRLTAYLVRAVQQLSARIDSLTTGENHV